MAAPDALGYRPGLDGVRGVAIALVVAFHLVGWPRGGGSLGVQVFFVLSGFLITTLLLEEHERTDRISLRHFYIRRGLRLLPLLYVALAITAVVTAIESADSKWYLHSIAASALYVGNLYGVVARNHTDLAPAVGHLWSLAVEEQFYVVWPFAVMALHRFAPRRMITLTAAGALLAIALRAVLLRRGETVWTLPTTYADALFAGCILAMWRRQRPDGLPKTNLLAALVLAGSCVVPTIALERGLGLLYLWPTALGVVLVVAGMSDVPWLRQRWLVYLGGISYGVYVLHGMVSYGLQPVIRDWNEWLGAIPILVVTLGIAAVSRRTLEAWFLRRKPEPPGRRLLTNVPGSQATAGD